MAPDGRDCQAKKEATENGKKRVARSANREGKGFGFMGTTRQILRKKAKNVDERKNKNNGKNKTIAFRLVCGRFLLFCSVFNFFVKVSLILVHFLLCHS